MWRRAVTAMLALGLPACAPPAPPPSGTARIDKLFPPAPSLTPSASASENFPEIKPKDEERCARDLECGYDPVGRACGTDPHFNKQPPIVDQGIVCYCDQGECALLRVDPVPCEGDQSCTILSEPRPHPARASSAHPPVKKPACSAGAKEAYFATCERTNICTMFRKECP